MNEHEMSLASTSNSFSISNTCLIQPIITMKSLTDNIKRPPDSGYYTNNTNSQDTNLRTINIMSHSVQKALDLLMDTLFNKSKLLDTVINWNNNSNLVKYFVDLIAKMAESTEFGFTCRDNVMTFVQNIAFKILDDHHLYNVSVVKTYYDYEGLIIVI